MYCDVRWQFWVCTQTLCRNVDRVLPYRYDAFWKLWQKRTKMKHKDLKALIPLPPSPRWVKWVVKCPSTELNRAYKIYMVCKEVLYMISPLIRMGEREWDPEHKGERARIRQWGVNWTHQGTDERYCLFWCLILCILSGHLVYLWFLKC